MTATERDELTAMFDAVIAKAVRWFVAAALASLAAAVALGWNLALAHSRLTAVEEKARSIEELRDELKAASRDIQWIRLHIQNGGPK